jgi:hypothetical protein
MLLIDPRHLPIAVWANQTARQLAGYGTIPKLTDEAQWQSWANLMQQLPGLSGVTLPWPQAFTNWRAWALQFGQAISPLPDRP